MSKRIMLTVAYDGTNYNGWQAQNGEVHNNSNTIEGQLNRALTDLTGNEVSVSGASRTDSGVHALCNLAVFDCDMRMPGDKFSFALNQRLPMDIRIRNSMEVADDFHPRFVSTLKTYEYTIWNDVFPNPLKDRYSLHCYGKIDTKLMQSGADKLVGEHDFAAFCTSGSQVRTTVRTITEAKVLRTPYEKGMSDGASEIVIRITGTGFLYNMVRIIAGTLIEIGKGTRDIDSIDLALESGDRKKAGPTAVAKGLCLVDYKFI